MEKLKDLQLKLLELNKIIDDHNHKLLEEPDNIEVRLSLASFESLYLDFKKQYMELAKEYSYDVIDYRIMNTNHQNIAINEITESLNLFQTLFSLVFDVSRNETPKNTTRISNEIKNSSSLKYGFSYAGSIGFVLTIDTHNNLFDKSIETTVKDTMSLISISDRQQLEKCITKFGVGTIKVFKNWVRINEKYGNELEIKTNNDKISPIFMNSERLEKVSEIISREPLITNETIKLENCELVGVDTLKETFHVVTEDKSYKGSISEGVNMTFSVPSQVNVELNEEIKELNGKVTKKYLLISID
jgi:hypothetical protein